MEPFYHDTTKQLLFIHHWMKKYNVIGGFTTKFGGQSQSDYYSNNLGLHVGDNHDDVLENRRSLAKKINVPIENWVMAEQTHGVNVERVSKKDRGKGIITLSDTIRDTDGFIITENDLLPCLLFADCVPLFFLAGNNAAAIAHAGWRGTVGNIAAETINNFTKLGFSIDQIEIVIGPSICQKCYQVSQEVIQHVPLKYNEVYRLENSHYYLDLKQLNYLQLLDTGIPGSNIHVTKYCTAHDDLFFSHRRDDQKTGRMLGFIGLM
ncbi:peptidoglycan editing factor PgeF [Gracilibacillus xinjiangensis]|uniref:Purine nucleoside phosphorylase n=1 Tax=Gracilibacillus xinjiangensis TaxID=1193282 RepID=A0ABV8X1A3_9BACI